MHILEVIRRCPHCKRESTVSPLEWKENPFCHICHNCLRERFEAARERIGPVSFAQSGNYTLIIPAT